MVCVFCFLCGNFGVAECNNSSAPSVLIIGGGPSGLATAIEARLNGCLVTVIEKRDSYSRLRGIGLWGYAISLLGKWNVEIPEMELSVLSEWDEEGALSGGVYINHLEARLEERCKKIGVKKIHGEFQCFEGPQIALIKGEGGELRIPYDIIVGADGPHSYVRDLIGIEKQHFGSAMGTVVIIPDLGNKVKFQISPILKQGHEFFRTLKLVSEVSFFAMQSPLECSKKDVRRVLESQGLSKDVRALDKGMMFFIENIPISLDQAVTFSNEAKSAILVGDAAASGSFLMGSGANTGLRAAEIAGWFFRDLQLDRDLAFQNFNKSMKEITDILIKKNLFLFPSEE